TDLSPYHPRTSSHLPVTTHHHRRTHPMSPWPGKRQLTVFTSCMNRNGFPTFTRTQVEVTVAEYENGLHYELAAKRLLDAGFKEPFVHYDSLEAGLLVAAITESVEAAMTLPDPIAED